MYKSEIKKAYLNKIIVFHEAIKMLMNKYNMERTEAVGYLINPDK